MATENTLIPSSPPAAVRAPKKFRWRRWLTAAMFVTPIVGACGVLPASTGSGPLLYRGGPVIHHPRVYIILWGPKWASRADIVYPFAALFQSMAGSPYGSTVSEYSDGSGSIANDTQLAGIISESGPPPTVDINAMQNIVNWEVLTHGLTVNADTQFMVLPQQGSTIAPLNGSNGFCAYHTWGQYLASLIPYEGDRFNLGGGTCDASGNGNVVADMTKAGSHEFMETLTDPRGTAWWAADGNENGDLCNGARVGTYLGIGPAGQTVNLLWSNANNGCEASPGSASLPSTLGPAIAAPGKPILRGNGFIGSPAQSN